MALTGLGISLEIFSGIISDFVRSYNGLLASKGLHVGLYPKKSSFLPLFTFILFSLLSGFFSLFLMVDTMAIGSLYTTIGRG
jgi:hypothetical protein